MTEKSFPYLKNATQKLWEAVSDLRVNVNNNCFAWVKKQNG